MHHSYKKFEFSRLLYLVSPESAESSASRKSGQLDHLDASYPDVVEKKGEDLFDRFERFRKNSLARREKRREDRRKGWEEWRAGREERVKERRKRVEDFRHLVRDLMSGGIVTSPLPKKSSKPIAEHYEKLIRKQIEVEERRSSSDKNAVTRVDLIERLMQDSSLKDLGLLRKEWVHDLVVSLPNIADLGKDLSMEDVRQSLTEKQFDDYYINAEAVICRNLYFQGKPVNKSNVREEVRRLIEIREKYADVPIFEGRNVVLVAHNELEQSDLYGDLNRFGKEHFVKRIWKDGAKTVAVIQPEETLMSLKEEKDRVLKELRETEPPFTFLFDGHGGPDAIYLSSGQILNGKPTEAQRTIKITVKELFRAYKDRQEDFPASKDPSKKDILINAGCFGANFIRMFYDLCDQSNIPKPIFAGLTEYGQFGYSTDSPFGNDFFEAMFNYGANSKATLGNLIDNDVSKINSNPSIYIPDDQNRTVQLAENELNKSDTETVDSQMA